MREEILVADAAASAADEINAASKEGKDLELDGIQAEKEREKRE